MIEFYEPSITIDGATISRACAGTIRVALSTMATQLSEEGLGNDEHGKFMTRAYLQNIRTILLLWRPPQVERKESRG